MLQKEPNVEEVADPRVSDTSSTCEKVSLPGLARVSGITIGPGSVVHEERLSDATVVPSPVQGFTNREIGGSGGSGGSESSAEKPRNNAELEGSVGGSGEVGGNEPLEGEDFPGDLRSFRERQRR